MFYFNLTAVVYAILDDGIIMNLIVHFVLK